MSIREAISPVAFGHFNPHRLLSATRRELTVRMNILLLSWKDILFNGCLIKNMCEYYGYLKKNIILKKYMVKPNVF